MLQKCFRFDRRAAGPKSLEQLVRVCGVEAEEADSVFGISCHKAREGRGEAERGRRRGGEEREREREREAGVGSVEGGRVCVCVWVFLFEWEAEGREKGGGGGGGGRETPQTPPHTGRSAR